MRKIRTKEREKKSLLNAIFVMYTVHCTLDIGHWTRSFDDTLATHTNMRCIINRVFGVYFYTVLCDLRCSALSPVDSLLIHCSVFQTPSRSLSHLWSLVSSPVSHDVLGCFINFMSRYSFHVQCRRFCFVQTLQKRSFANSLDQMLSSQQHFLLFIFSVSFLRLLAQIVCFVACVAKFPLNLILRCIFRNVSLCVLCAPINFLFADSFLHHLELLN